MITIHIRLIWIVFIFNFLQTVPACKRIFHLALKLVKYQQVDGWELINIYINRRTDLFKSKKAITLYKFVLFNRSIISDTEQILNHWSRSKQT